MSKILSKIIARNVLIINTGSKISKIFWLFIPNEVFKLVAFTDSFLTFQVYLFLPLADADASA